MKTFVLFLVFLLLRPFAISADEERDSGGLDIGEGMEIRRVGGFNLLVPKDARVWKEGGVLKVEGGAEYSAGRLREVEKRLETIEAALAQLQNQIDALKSRLDKTGRSE